MAEPSGSPLTALRRAIGRASSRAWERMRRAAAEFGGGVETGRLWAARRVKGAWRWVRNRPPVNRVNVTIALYGLLVFRLVIGGYGAESFALAPKDPRDDPVSLEELIVVSMVPWALFGYILSGLFRPAYEQDPGAFEAGARRQGGDAFEAFVRLVIVTALQLLASAIVYLRQAPLSCGAMPAEADPALCEAPLTTFVEALYFSIVTWTTLGYGDFSPAPRLRLFAANEALLGYFSVGVLVALLLRGLSRSSPQTPTRIAADRPQTEAVTRLRRSTPKRRLTRRSSQTTTR